MHIAVSDSSMVGEARRATAALAQRAGLDADAASRAALAATEIGTNLIKHAKAGTLVIDSYCDAQGTGIELLAFDSGPGIGDVARAMADGYSTAGSQGTGLGAIRRQSDHFDIYSKPGSGTVLMARFGNPSPASSRQGAVIGAVGQPYPGEEECGDAWAYLERGGLRRLIVADGSGHGRAAAAAAKIAVKAFGDGAALDGERLMDSVHRALFSTRGAAVAIAGYSREERLVRLVGVGNIAAAFVDGAATRRMVSHNGTAGQIAPRIREFTYPCEGFPVILLHSDGLSSKWDFSSYPGLAASHPSVIAGVLYRDYHRGRDDFPRRSYEDAAVKNRLLTVAIENETDIVLVRNRTRHVAGLIGFDKQDQTRITTAVSEIARNAWEYGKGGRIEYSLTGESAPEWLEIIASDKGKGIADINAILSGTYRSATGMGVGILGARRLMDEFEIGSAPGKGTRVVMRKALPKREPKLQARDLQRISGDLAAGSPLLDPMVEIRRQNQEMLAQLEELQEKQEQLVQLNQELQDTNRGVVALYAELDERAGHLRRADELKSRFLSNMTHEFRTPLNSILGLSRLLLTRIDGPLSSEQEKQIGYIRTAAENLTELVNDLLDLAKVEAGKTVVAPVEFSVSGLFGALRGMLRPLLVGDAVALSFEDPDDPRPLFTDEGKVSQILRNFISNALKFTERGLVRVWAENDDEAGTITFFVRDTGTGIAPEHLDVIWQEFSQVAQSTPVKIKGTGLGLPISKRFAELLGGEVGVESEFGTGSVFWVRVPRVHHRADDEDLELNLVLQPGRVPVLAVEDDGADSFALERAFASTRYQLIPVKSTAQARRAVERFAPAAVVLDVMLATEESWRFLIDMKQREATQSIPIIVVSSSSEEHKARSLGADEYLDKPVDPAEIVQTVDAMTGSRFVTRVLVIDDEEVFRYLVRQLLPRGGFEINEASNCAEGMARAATSTPDVILIDLNMPDGTGFELLEKLSARPELKNVPKIVLTSLKLDSDQRLKLLPADHIISKAELSADLLISKIQSAMSRRAA